jgi:CHAP domain.
MRKTTSLMLTLLILITLVLHNFNKNDEEQTSETSLININENIIDQYLNVPVYYNTNISLPFHYSHDGYPYGIRWQCVEFIKRFYYDAFNHAMPNVYGHAVDFYDPHLIHASYNSDRGMYQYQNNQNTKPKINDLIVFNGTNNNPYGHVAIITAVNENSIEIIQQNSGFNSRDELSLISDRNNHKVIHPYMEVLGWLRLVE